MRPLSLDDRGAEPLDGDGPVAAHRDHRVGRTGRECGDQDALDNEMWISLGQGTVAQRWVCADEVGDDDFASCPRRPSGAPLVGGGVSTATAAAEARLGNLVDGAPG